MDEGSALGLGEIVGLVVGTCLELVCRPFPAIDKLLLLSCGAYRLLSANSGEALSHSGFHLKSKLSSSLEFSLFTIASFNCAST